MQFGGSSIHTTTKPPSQTPPESSPLFTVLAGIEFKGFFGKERGGGVETSRNLFLVLGPRFSHMASMSMHATSFFKKKTGCSNALAGLEGVVAVPDRLWPS